MLSVNKRKINLRSYVIVIAGVPLAKSKCQDLRGGRHGTSAEDQRRRDH